VTKTCPKCQRLFAAWTENSNRLWLLLNEKTGEIRDAISDFRHLDGEIRRAKTAEHETSQDYYQQVDTHTSE
jgi:hypothetical protein